MIRERIANAAALVLCVALALWAVWPRQRGERSFYQRGRFPSSTNETRNLFMAVAVTAWVVWLASYYSEGLFYLSIYFGGSAVLALLVWVAEKWGSRR